MKTGEVTSLMAHPHSQIITDGSSVKFQCRGMKLSKCKLFLTTILVILSCGFLLLVMRWYPKIRRILTLEQSVLVLATHVYLQCLETDEGGISRIKEHKGTKYFNFQYAKYIYNNGAFSLVDGLEPLHYSDIHAMCGGLTNSVLEYKMDKYGLNIISVPVPSYIKLFFTELLQPFYIFQIGAVILWMWDDYRLYATAIAIISVVSIGITIYEQRQQKLKIRGMATSSLNVDVVRNGESMTLESCHLLPGDVMHIPRDGLLLSCDAVLVSGSAIVNECALTGESIPVTKSSVPYISKFIYESGDRETVMMSEDRLYDPEADKKFSLFSGTTVLQSKPTSGNSAVAVVTKTGFSTFKGSLIRSILCPKPTKFEFQADAQRFIIMLSAFAAIGFIYTFYISLKLGGSIAKTIRLGLDLVTVVVPPALPAALTIGVVYAVQRLKKAKIFCIDPQRVNYCGKIQYICFDKTGTLTEDGLSVLSAIPSNKMFLAPVDTGDKVFSEQLIHSLATCHEISTLNNEMIGDPLDIEMFKFTGWNFEECEEGNPLANLVTAIVSPPAMGHSDDVTAEIGIIKSFPFTSELQRMCVVTKNLMSDEVLVFCKGSPEMIQTLSNKGSIPYDYADMLDSYTKEGYRVIAFGWKALDPDLNWHNIQRMSRSDLECDLNFCGFLVMENHLKEDTASCILDLSHSNTQVCMVTGDNILTAITVSKKCGIVPYSGSQCDVILLKKEGEGVTLQIDFQNDKAVRLDVECSQENILSAIDSLTTNRYVLAVTGPVFKYISEKMPLLYELVLLKCKVFARMKPGSKQKLIEDLQKVGYIVAMCGDGANDCAALKSAHAGVSLSEAEASIAAPFTSANHSISCMIEVLRQGRAAVITASVTFRFMAMYSMVQFITQLLHYSMGSNMTDSQFLYIDMFVITGIAATLGHAKPTEILAPSTPAARLIDLKMFVLLTLHVLVTFAFQFAFFMYIKAQPFFIPFKPAHDLKEGACFENTALFVSSGFQYALYGVLLCEGAPHQMPVYRNWTLMIVFVISAIMSVLFVFQPLPFLNNLMNLVSLEDIDVQITFILLMGLNFVVVYLVEELLANEKMTRLLNNVKICLNKPKPDFEVMSEQWETLSTADFTTKNFYK